MGTVRELKSRSEASERPSERPLIRLIVNDTGKDSKVIHFHRARGDRRAVRISHPSMFSGNRFPWDPDRPGPSDAAPDEGAR